MKKFILEQDLPDLEVLSDENDIMDYVISQAKKGKQITTQILSKQFRLPERTSNALLNKLLSENKLKSKMMRVINNQGKPVRMKVFSKK